MIRRPPRSTQSRSSAASDVYKRQDWSHPEHPEEITLYSRGLRSAGTFPYRMMRMNSWIYLNTRRATCSKRTVCRCSLAPSPRQWKKPAQRQQRSAPTAEEYYFSVLLDRANRSYLAMASKEGGVEIEVLAVERPEALARIPVDPIVGIDAAKAKEIVDAANFDEDVKVQIAEAMQKLWTVYRDEDATLVEVNPLVKTTEGRIVALDGKVTLDDNAGFRHLAHEALEDKASADPLEAAAKAKDLNYVRLDGSVGVIGNGAGLVMSTLDVVAYAGEEFGAPGNHPRPANFLDIGGGASAEVMIDGLHIMLGDENVKSVLVNVFGGITSCDEVANGIVGALKVLGDEATKPLVVRLDGNKVDEGRRILAEFGHPLVTVEETMDGAARKAAELASAANTN